MKFMSSDRTNGPGTGAGEGEDAMGVRIYCRMMESLLTADSPLKAKYFEEARQLHKELSPRDAVEKIFVDQILWLHARLAHLNYYSTLQTQLKPMQVMHAACDRLADAMRRHLMAFAEYRQPERRRFTAVRQANIAQQQIVTSASLSEGNLQSGKGGLDHDGAVERVISEAQKATLSALEERLTQAAAECAKDSAVEVGVGAEDEDGEETI
jgi:hypothetical protein